MKTRLIIFSILVVIISACNGRSIPEVDPDDYDWCYTFDFINEVYTLNFVEGFQSQYGLTSLNGLLDVDYQHNQIIEPLYISSDVYIQIPDTNSRTVTAILDIFGIQAQLQGSVSGNSEVTINGVPDSAAIFGSTASIDVTAPSDTLVVVETLTVYGNSTNPFSRNDCADTQVATQTATFEQLPTLTPTFTPSATFTALPTNTSIPTNTPTNTPEVTATDDGTWCYFFDFSVTDGGFYQYDTSGASGLQGYGVHTLGYGWEHSDLTLTGGRIVRSINIELLFPLANVSYVSLDSARSSSQIYDYQLYGDRVYLLDGSTWVLTTSRGGVSGIRLGVKVSDSGSDSGVDPNSYAVFYSVQIGGTGNNPFGSDNCDLQGTYTPSPEPTITNTPDDTSTPEATATDDGNGGGGNNGDISGTGTPTPITPEFTSTPRPTNTPFPTITPIATRTPGPTPTPLPTQMPSPGDDGNGFSGSGECGNNAGAEPTDDTTGKWTDWLFGGIEKLVECVVMPPVNFIADLANQAVAMVGSVYDVVVDSAQYTRSAIQWVVGQGLPYTGAWLNNLLAMAQYYTGTFFSGAIGFITNLWNFVTGLIDTIYNFMQGILNFILTGFNVGSDLFLLWNDATPQKPPGLPDCVNDPMNYEICAVYYVAEHTVLAGVGAFIVPALSGGIVILIVLLFMESITERMKKLWGVLNAD